MFDGDMAIKNFISASAIIFLLIGASACSGPAPSESSLEASSCLADLPHPVQLTAGLAIIGSDRAYAEEAPKRQIKVEGFEIDAHEVTNGQFAQFVKDTGYITVAERVPDPALIPQGAPEDAYKPGSAVFLMPTASSPNWWHYIAGANWRHPTGPDSSIEGKDNHPVVQIAFEDAQAYAKWAGRRLPDEAEWEYAAQGGVGTLYPWGDNLSEDEAYHANIWQGAFPIQNSAKDGYQATAPAGCFNANEFGLYDMIGNVWEWTNTPFEAHSFDPAAPIYAMKGGSYLCAANFCRRYRASARHPQEGGLGTNHIGFRTAKDL